jgi:hypothetical protein
MLPCSDCGFLVRITGEDCPPERYRYVRRDLLNGGGDWSQRLATCTAETQTGCFDLRICVMIVFDI